MLRRGVAPTEYRAYDRPVNIDMKALARMGAAIRLEELAVEMNGIRTAFPDLNDETPRGARGAMSHQPQRGGRGRMSAAERKAVSARMKRYWATRREGEPSLAARLLADTPTVAAATPPALPARSVRGPSTARVATARSKRKARRSGGTKKR
jgi:hypothetical protein